MADIPDSPHSSSLSLSFSSSSPILDSSTLALLDAFLLAKADEEQRFHDLAAEQAAARVAGLALEGIPVPDSGEKPMLSVDEYRLAFGEDWQLSQFWYSTAFANRLASIVHSMCTPSSTIAFICCPTAFVAFQHMKQLAGVKLLEFDRRFSILSPSQFVPYDLDEPDKFPNSLKGTFDFAVVDPPFLNEVTNAKVIRTLRQLLHPTRGKLILITSTSIEEIINRLYDKQPLGPLRKMALNVEQGQLANDFACWGSWNGAEKIGNHEDKS